MRTFRNAGMVAISLVLTATLASAMTIEDVIKLAQAGLSDDVIVSQVDAQEAVFNLSTDDIIRLKECKVSDRVIAHMILTKIRAKRIEVKRVEEPAPGEATQTPEKKEPQTTPQTPPEKKEPLRPFGTGEGCVTFQNFDDRSYSIQIDEKGKFIFYYYGDLRDRLCLDKNSAATVELAEGEYRVRWVGERSVFTFRLYQGDNVKLTTTGINLEKYKAVDMSIFENEKEKVTGTLKKFYEEVPSVGTGVEPTTRVEVVTQRIVEQPRQYVIVQPSPSYRAYYTNYYPTGWYYTSGYYSPYYYRTYGREHSLLSPRTVFWGAVGAAYYEHKHGKPWKGAAAGAAFGHLLDHLLDD